MSMYKKTIIYSISCKDKSISDFYIGHTVDFDNRCRSHECSSYTSELKVYKFIREHGGWSNWEMNILSDVSCANRGDAALEEMFWYFKLKPGLNSLIPGLNYFKRSIVHDKLYEKRKDVLDRIVLITMWPKVV
jgi:hypothetical protein